MPNEESDEIRRCENRVSKIESPPGISQVKVSATYDFSLLTPLITQIMGGPIRMTATTTAAVL